MFYIFAIERSSLKILVIRLSSIGDIVLSSPVIRCLKTQLPGAEVHYLTKTAHYEVLRGNPYVDQIHLLDVNLDKVIKTLQKQEFDYIIDLHNNLRSYQIKRRLKAKSLSFSKINLRKWLAVRFKWQVLPDLHIVDRYLATVERMGLTNDLKGLDYFIPDDCRVNPADVHPALAAGYIGLVIGGQHATKQLPREKLLQLCQGLSLPVLLLGGSGDKAVAAWLMKQETEKLIIDACGAFNLNESADLVRQAAVIITHDTGLMHVAAAFRKKTLSIWGNTIPAFGMYPYQPGTEQNTQNFEVAGLDCRPCSKIGFSKCPRSHFKCMVMQDTSAIAAAANEGIG